MNFNDNLNPKWVSVGLDDYTVDWADQFGKHLTSNTNDLKPLTTSQLRRFFGELKRIQSDFQNNQNDIPLLKVKLAYAVGRDKKKERGRGHVIKSQSKIIDFYNQLNVGFSELNLKNNDLEKRFNNFTKIIEAIVAFHKYHGGDPK